jgi:major membrane immunogen (membrane-anchored lipoprotein)
MKLRMAVVLAIVALCFAVSTFAADISGQWTASFDTQIGTQNYTYTFKVDGEKLTGTAKSDNGESQITDGTVKGDEVKFTENLDMQGTAIAITYTGKIADDNTINFTRQVGDFATETLVAKRAKP